MAQVNLNAATIDDATGNPADLSGAVNLPLGTNLQVGPAFVTAVTSSWSANGANVEANTGIFMYITLAMSEGVAVNTAGGAPTLTLNDNATATYDANASDPSAGTLVFDYTVGTNDQAPDLEVMAVNLPSGTTIKDANGVNADLSAALDAPTFLTINSPLTVQSVSTSATGEVDAGASVAITLTMSESFLISTLLGSPTLSFDDLGTGTYNATVSNPAAGKLVFDYTVGADDQTPDLTVLQVNLNGAVVQDTHGNAADFSDAYFATDLQVGLVSVSSVEASESAGTDITTGETVSTTVQMNDGVTVSGSPILKLNDNATAAYDANASNPSSGMLVFDYTVGANDYTTNLAATGIELNGATIKDANGVNADLSGVAQDFGLDVNAAVVTAVTASQTGEVGAGQTVALTLAMSEDVTVNTSLGTATLTLNDGGTATYDANASDPSAGTLVFSYNVGANDWTPDLAVNQVNLNGATIEDANGNAADLSGAAIGSIAAQDGSVQYEIDLQVNPAFVTGVQVDGGGGNILYVSQFGNAYSAGADINTGQTVYIAYGMAEGVTVNTSGGSPTLTLNDNATATYDANSAGALVFEYTVGATDYSTDLAATVINLNGSTIQDVNGVNANLSGAAQSLGLDVNAALVTAVTASQTGEVEAGQTIKLTLTMNESVTVNTSLGSPTLTLNDGATATYDANASNPSAGSLVFDYSVGVVDQTPQLAVTQVNLNGATIEDANGNAAVLSGAITVPSNGEVGVNLQVGPASVTGVYASQDGNIYAGSGDATTGQIVAIAIVMNEGVTVDTAGGAATLTLNDGATASYDANASNSILRHPGIRLHGRRE